MGLDMRLVLLTLIALVTTSGTASADAIRQTKGEYYDAFRQLDVDLPTANVYRTASGAPGPRYWQQRADMQIKVTLDENTRRIIGSETINYTNRSPDTLRYIWLQLDQNRFADDSLERLSETAVEAAGREDWGEAEDKDVLTYGSIARHQLAKDIDYGYEIGRVVDGFQCRLLFQQSDRIPFGKCHLTKIILIHSGDNTKQGAFS